MFSGKKKEHKGLVRRPPGRGGGLPREGVVVEKFVPSLESLSSLGLEGRNLVCHPGNFAGISRTPKSLFRKFVQKKFVLICVPLCSVRMSGTSRAYYSAGH